MHDFERGRQREMIRAIFLDFYGTLAGWQPAAEEIQRDAAAAEGVDVDPTAVLDAYPTANALMDRENARLRIASRTDADRDAFFADYERTLLTTAGYDVPLELAARVWARVRATPKGLALYPDALPAVRGLHEAGLRVGVISNMGAELSHLVEDAGLGGYVDVCVSSAEAGVTKPHPAIFKWGLARVGVDAEEAVHVGDGYDSDVVGARNAGMHAVMLVRPHTAGPPDGSPTVEGLDEVLPYLRRLGMTG